VAGESKQLAVGEENVMENKNYELVIDQILNVARALRNSSLATQSQINRINNALLVVSTSLCVVAGAVIFLLMKPLFI
jgi:hypothetical protein